MKLKSVFLSLLFAALIFPVFAQAAVENDKPAPDFSLTDINGNTRSLSEFKGKFVVLEWVNHDCPFVKKHYDHGNMQKLQADYAAKDVAWLSINSSAEGKQGHNAPEKWKEIQAEKKSSATATLLDPQGTVGNLYGAKTTPHMYIVNPQGVLIYQGAIDSVKSSDSDDIASAENYVSRALDEAMGGKPVTTASTKSYGCSVKY